MVAKVMDTIRDVRARQVIEQTRDLARTLLTAIDAEIDEQSILDVAKILRAMRDASLEQAALACESVAALRPTHTDCAEAIRRLKVGQ